MSEPGSGPPRIRPRQSLSGRLWLLATLAVLLSEVVVFLPYVAHERSSWLAGQIEDASIALSAAGLPIDAAQRDAVLRATRADAIRVNAPGTPGLTFGNFAEQPEATIDLWHEGEFSRIRQALQAIVFEENRLIRIVAGDPFRPGGEIELTVREGPLNRTLRQFAGDFAGLSLLVAGVTGGLVYCAVLLLLVRPMRRITGSIAEFRADPERTRPLDPSDVSLLSNDEIAVAGQELAAMQHELRAALWRNARLAALGTVVAKVSHDLRGILTPALLTAERLQLNADPRVQRAGETVVQAVDRATALVRRTLDYAREGPPPLDLLPVPLAPLVNEAVEAARPLGASLRLENVVHPDILVRADRMQLFRVLTNLLRNAAEAGARVVCVTAQQSSPILVVEITDDGPGLPEPVRADLFRPFASMRRGGTGLGLAIARDLMVAHGGDIVLVATGESGTTFRLTLRAAEPAEAPRPTDAAARIAPTASADV
jgi:signal transduction histidine kinase